MKRHVPTGDFQRECPNCGIIFRTDNDRTVYCSPECKRKQAWIRWYEKNREQVNSRMRNYQRKKRRSIE